MTNDDIQIRFQAKNEIRKRMKAVRNAYPRNVRLKKSLEIHRKLFEQTEWRQARNVAFYLSKGSEVETEPLIEQALLEQKKVSLPKMNRNELDFELRQVTSLTELEEGAFGVMEPSEHSVSVASNSIDLILVPALAVDLQGYRIGYGGGVYDRFLQSIKGCTAIALVFDFQLISEVPRTPNDQPVSQIVTDKQIVTM